MRAASGSHQMLYSAAGVTFAMRAGSAPHHDAARNLPGDIGRLAQGKRKIGQRPQRDDNETGRGTRRLDDGSYGVDVTCLGALRQVAIAPITQAVRAVKPVGRGIFAQQRHRSASMHRHARLAELREIEGVDDTLWQRHISGDDRDGAHLHIRVAQRHQYRDGVIGAGVGVDQEGACHAMLPLLRCSRQLLYRRPQPLQALFQCARAGQPKFRRTKPSPASPKKPPGLGAMPAPWWKKSIKSPSIGRSRISIQSR